VLISTETLRLSVTGTAMEERAICGEEKENSLHFFLRKVYSPIGRPLFRRAEQGKHEARYLLGTVQISDAELWNASTTLGRNNHRKAVRLRERHDGRGRNGSFSLSLDFHLIRIVLRYRVAYFIL
jgi:hypothetical protein